MGLYLVEDSLGWTWARCWPVRVANGARVYEVDGPQDWVELVGRYPLKVTEGRRHDWQRVTGRDGAWVIPDFLAVAGDYDAIHLSLVGYLSTAGRTLPVGGQHTMLAGWSPDETWWLNDRPVRVGEGVRWGQGLGSELLAWAPS